MTQTQKNASKSTQRAGSKLTQKVEIKSSENPFAIEFKVDLMAFVLFLVSFATRMIYLDQPKNVV
jgi:hypothetical protein